MSARQFTAEYMPIDGKKWSLIGHYPTRDAANTAVASHAHEFEYACNGALYRIRELSPRRNNFARGGVK